MLMQHLVAEPAWLNRRLDVPRVDELANDGATSLLYFVRRYCAKLLYEIEFFQADDPASMRAALRRAPDRRAEAAGEPGELPRRHRRLVLRHRLPALVGLRGAAARLPAQRVRQRLVRAARGRRPAARALVARPGPDGRRAAPRRHRREARDGLGCRAGCRRSHTLRKWPMCTHGQHDADRELRCPDQAEFPVAHQVFTGSLQESCGEKVTTWVVRECRRQLPSFS